MLALQRPHPPLVLLLPRSQLAPQAVQLGLQLCHCARAAGAGLTLQRLLLALRLRVRLHQRSPQRRVLRFQLLQAVRGTSAAAGR